MDGCGGADRSAVCWRRKADLLLLSTRCAAMNPDSRRAARLGKRLRNCGGHRRCCRWITGVHPDVAGYVAPAAPPRSGDAAFQTALAARERNSELACRRTGEQGNRLATEDLRAHRQIPHRLPLQQAECLHACRSRGHWCSARFDPPIAFGYSLCNPPGFAEVGACKPSGLDFAGACDMVMSAVPAEKNGDPTLATVKNERTANARAASANDSRYLPLLLLFFRGQRLRRADLRNRLVPVAAAGDRLHGGFTRRSCSRRSWAAFAWAALRCRASAPRASASAACLRADRTWHRHSAALLVLFAMPLVDYVYVAAVGHGLPAILLRALICAICLLPPTFLMGASLPAISRWIQTTRRGVSWLGFLYGGNTAGAVFGCLLAGFYLLRVFNMATATSSPRRSICWWRWSASTSSRARRSIVIAG